MISAPNRTRSKFRKRVLPFMMIVFAVALYSCYPGGPTDVTDYDLVITAFDENFNYGAIKTWAMPDSVVQIDSTQTISQSSQQLILDQVAMNMNALGYTRIINPDTIPPDSIPDVVVLVYSTTQEWSAWVSYPWWDYWGWWPGWGYYPPYGPGWGWGYPPTGSFYSYNVGTLIIDMVEGVPDDPSGQIAKGIWGAGIAGLLENSQVNNQQRAQDLIDQAFAQSPYLGAE